MQMRIDRRTLTMKLLTLSAIQALPLTLAFHSPLAMRLYRSLKHLSPFDDKFSHQADVFTTNIVQLDQSPADDLTREELESRFSDVLSYFSSLPAGNPLLAQFTETYTPQIALLRGRLADIHLSRCSVQPSTIEGAGNGVFATRDIMANELITLYPGDAILIRTGELDEVSGVLYGSNYQDPSLTHDAARAYEIRISPIHSIVGNKDNISDSSYIGHIANDGAILTDGSDAARTLYSKQSAQTANAAHQFLLGGCHVGLFALCDIAEGSEIFVSYGEGYWLSRGSSEMYEEAQRGDKSRSMQQTKGNATKKKKKRSNVIARGFK